MIVAIPPGMSAAQKASLTDLGVRVPAVESISAERLWTPSRSMVYNDVPNPNGVAGTGWTPFGSGPGLTPGVTDPDIGGCAELAVTSDGGVTFVAQSVIAIRVGHAVYAAMQVKGHSLATPAVVALSVRYYTTGLAAIGASRLVDIRYIEQDDVFTLEGFEQAAPATAVWLLATLNTYGGSGTRTYRVNRGQVTVRPKRITGPVDGSHGGAWIGAADASASKGYIDAPGREFEWGAHRFAMHAQTDEQRRATLDLTAHTGARWLRFGIGQVDDGVTWDFGTGVCDFSTSKYPAIIEDCKARGLKVLALVGGSPAGYPPTLAQAAELDLFYTEMALQLPGIDAFEVWNEPNLGFFWGGAPDAVDTAALTPLHTDPIRAVRPDVLIGGPAVSHRQTTGGGDVAQVAWLQDFLDADGADTLDYISCHPYPYLAATSGNLAGVGTWDAGFGTNVFQVENELRLRGIDKPLWFTELGINDADVSRVVTPSQVARGLALLWGIIARRGDAGPPFLHTIESHPPGDANVGLNMVDSASYRRKPAVVALRELSGVEEVGDWHEFGREGPAFAGTWFAAITDPLPAYRVKDGFCELRGHVSCSPTSNGLSLIATLPPEARPSDLIYRPITINGGVVATLNVGSNGDVFVIGATATVAGTFTSLAGVRFEVGR